LENAEAGLAVASGMAVISSTLWTLLEAGDAVVIDHTLYGNSFALFVRGLTRFGVKVAVADFTDLNAAAAAIAKGAPKLVFFETPANPNLGIIDIAAIGRMAHEAGALLIVDNTFATPAVQQPILLGADLVVHSATKFIGGHGDLIAGIVAGPKEIVEHIRRHGLRYFTGATIAPLTAFLLLRGLRTLELRMERHCSSALAIAQVLQQHPAIAWVSYPGFMNRLALVTRAVSLGDAETLVQHPASMTHSSYTPEERQKHRISDGLIRFSIGLKTLSDLTHDILQALDAIHF